MKSIITFIISLCFICQSTYAQDTILTLEGNVILTKEYKFDESLQEIMYKTEKMKIKSISSDDVFSATDAKGNETVFYKYDPAQGNGIEVKDMRSYVRGQAAARQYHSEAFSFLYGFCTGFGGVYLMPEIGGTVMYAPLVPVAGISILALTRPDGKKLALKQFGTTRPELFYEGYANRAKTKRMNNAVIGAIAGLLSGALLYSVSN